MESIAFFGQNGDAANRSFQEADDRNKAKIKSESNGVRPPSATDLFVIVTVWLSPDMDVCNDVSPLTSMTPANWLEQEDSRAKTGKTVDAPVGRYLN